MYLTIVDTYHDVLVTVAATNRGQNHGNNLTIICRNRAAEAMEKNR